MCGGPFYFSSAVHGVADKYLENEGLQPGVPDGDAERLRALEKAMHNVGKLSAEEKPVVSAAEGALKPAAAGAAGIPLADV